MRSIDDQLEVLEPSLEALQAVDNPVYAVGLRWLPPELQAPNTAGCHVAGGDHFVQAPLTTLGRWRGRGSALYLSEDTPRDCWRPFLQHELAHACCNPPGPASDKMFRTLVALAREEERRGVKPEPPALDKFPDIAKEHHGPRWVRALCHIACRGHLLLGWNLDARAFVSVQRYGHFPCAFYLNSLAMAGELGDVTTPIVEILQEPAPAQFTELFEEQGQ